MFSAAWRMMSHAYVKTLAAIFFTLLGVYGTFIYERKPDLTLQVLTNFSVLDLKERVSRLAVLYNGVDLAEKRQALYVVNARFANTGNAEILKAAFDDVDPSGFMVTQGSIIEAHALSTDPYLAKNLRLHITNTSVSFSPVILNSGDGFEIKALILGQDSVKPRITPTGKIAGIRQIRLEEVYKDSRDANLISSIFAGGWAVHLGRIVFYFPIGLFTIVTLTMLIVAPYEAINKIRKKRQRKTRVESYKESQSGPFSLKDQYLFNMYIEGEGPAFSLLRTLCQQTEGTVILSNGLFISSRGFLKPQELDELAAAQLILKDGPEISLAPDFIESCRAFMSYVGSSRRANLTDEATNVSPTNA